MLRMVLGTDKGPIGIVGINHENWRRLEAGMPLDIDLKAMTPPGTRMNRLLIHYARTYEDVIRDMQEEGLPVEEKHLEEARRLDKELADGVPG